MVLPVTWFPVLFMYFSRLLVPEVSHMIFSSVHGMANVGKHCSCVCDSLKVTTDKMDKRLLKELCKSKEVHLIRLLVELKSVN